MFERFRLVSEKRPYRDVNVVATSHGNIISYHLVEDEKPITTVARRYSTKRSFGSFLRLLFLGEIETESIPDEPTTRQDISRILKNQRYIEPITFP